MHEYAIIFFISVFNCLIGTWDKNENDCHEQHNKICSAMCIVGKIIYGRLVGVCELYIIKYIHIKSFF